jgi:hypothetical protein
MYFVYIMYTNIYIYTYIEKLAVCRENEVHLTYVLEHLINK